MARSREGADGAREPLPGRGEGGKRRRCILCRALHCLASTGGALVPHNLPTNTALNCETLSALSGAGALGRWAASWSSRTNLRARGSGAAATSRASQSVPYTSASTASTGLTRSTGTVASTGRPRSTGSTGRHAETTRQLPRERGAASVAVD